MIRRSTQVYTLLGGVVAAFFVIWLQAGPPGPVLYLGGPIITMDSSNRVVEALAVDGERIEAVGSEAELRGWAERRNARIVDLAGRALLPGFIDAHGHFPGEGMTAYHVDLNSPPIGDVQGIDDLVALLQERAAQTSHGDWVIGMGYDDMLFAERRHPTREDLDRVSLDHPVAAVHISGHLWSVNSAALAEVGLDRDSPDPEGGVIRRDPSTGELTGMLEENAAMALNKYLSPGVLGGLRVLRRANERYLAAGVTTAQSGLSPGVVLQAASWLPTLGLTPLRLVAWPDAKAAEAILDGSLSLRFSDPLRVRLGAVKLIADGSPQGYTGYFRDPYWVVPGDDEGYRGYPRMERETLMAQVLRFHSAGMQVAVHGNGDAAIDDVLDAFEAAQRAHPRDDARHIVIHAQMAREDQLDRMKQLEVLPSFFGLHTYYWGDRHREIFMGPERAARISPAQSALRRDLRFTLHADSPVVPMEPLRIVWAAVNRLTRSGAILGPDQRITPMQALRAITIDAAWQHFEDGEKGSLEPGKLADLVILSRSPLEAPESILEIRVIETIIGGRTEYEADTEVL